MGIATLTKSAALTSPELHILSDEELRKLQLLLLEMTGDIAQICAENDICWSLGGGSLLGAVRHNGFIPWDDDVDITMPRADFERFKKVFPGTLSDKYELKLPGDPGYLYHFPKVYRKGTIAQTIQSSEEETECVCVDIFIMENASDCPFLRTLHGIVCSAMLAIDSALRMKRCRNNLMRYASDDKKLRRAVSIRVLFSAFVSFAGLERWLRLSDRLFSMCRDQSSEYIVIPSGNGHYFGELFLRNKLLTLEQHGFEDQRYYIPVDPGYYLNLRYGPDHMAIPQDHSKEHHVYIKFHLPDT